jgi:hypothetical protein
MNGPRTQRRRNIARVLFVACCLCPTVGLSIASAVAHARRSAAESLVQWKDAIQFQLGLSVDVERVEPATHGVTLHNVQLRHPETDETVAHFRQIYVAQVAQRGWVVECRYPEIDAENFAVLWGVLEDRLTNRRGSEKWSGSLTATNIAWRNNDDVSTIPLLGCTVRHSLDSSHVKVEYHLENAQADTPAQLVIVRQRDDGENSAGTTYAWNTQGNPFPLSWLTSAFPQLERLGPAAEFEGTVTMQQQSDLLSGTLNAPTSDGELDGKISNLDLAELMRPFPHHVLRGTAEMQFQNLVWRDGKLAEVEGQFVAQNGSVSLSVLLAARHLGLLPLTSLASEPTIAYRRFAFDFVGKADRLRLTSQTENQDVMVGWKRDELAFLISRGKEIETTGILRWLVPDSTHLVPATEQVGWLASLIQLPETRPSDNSAVSTPAASLNAHNAPPALPRDVEPSGAIIRPPSQ